MGEGRIAELTDLEAIVVAMMTAPERASDVLEPFSTADSGVHISGADWRAEVEREAANGMRLAD